MIAGQLKLGHAITDNHGHVERAAAPAALSQQIAARRAAHVVAAAHEHGRLIRAVKLDAHAVALAGHIQPERHVFALRRKRQLQAERAVRVGQMRASAAQRRLDMGGRKGSVLHKAGQNLIDKARAQRAVGADDQLVRHHAAAPRAFGRPAGQQPPPVQHRRLGHTATGAIEHVLAQPPPRAERPVRDDIARRKLIGIDQIVQIVQLEIIAALGLIVQPRHEHGRALRPVDQVFAHQMRQTAAALLHIRERGGHHHVVQPVLAQPHLGIARAGRLIGCGQLEITAALFEMNAVVALRPGEPRGRAVRHPHRVERVHAAVLLDHRAGADRAFPLRVDPQRDGMQRPAV